MLVYQVNLVGEELHNIVAYAEQFPVGLVVQVTILELLTQLTGHLREVMLLSPAVVIST